MNQSEQNILQQLAFELRELATEVHVLGYSTAVASGSEGRFLELSKRMHGRADALTQAAAARSA